MELNYKNERASNEKEQKETETSDEKAFRMKAGIFLASVTGISALIGFGSTLASVKKKDPEFFNKGVAGTREMAETGASLAMRALGWGTLYAFLGCGALFYSVWKLSGATDMKAFRMKMGSVLPRIPKNDPPQGRTEFSGLTDLLTYLASDEAKTNIGSKD